MTSVESGGRLASWQRMGLALSAVALAGCGPANHHNVAQPNPETEPPTTEKLNVITVIVDDMDDFSCQDTALYLPKSSKYLKDQGTCYENARVASPVCCPSRAAYMTGEFPHNDQVRTLYDGDKIAIKDTLQYAFRGAGLTTYGVGKWLGGVSMEELADPAYDSGFSQENLWLPLRYTEYPIINDKGEVVTPEHQPHTTTYTGNHLNTFVTDMLEQGKQFYAYGAFIAPHTQHNTPTEKGLFPEPTAANRDKPVPPFVYDPEPNTKDKLPIFQLPSRGQNYYERLQTARVRSEYDVDDQVAKLFEILEEHDAADNTAVVFTSDNGYELGRNNWQFKGTPYAASLDVPLLVYLPGTFAASAVDNRPVNLIDIAPTFYKLLGVKPNHQLDGHSLLSDYRRKSEYYELDSAYRGDAGENVGAVPSWSEYVEKDKSYIQYYDKNGTVIAEEFYADPGDKRNLLYPAFADEAPDSRVLERFRNALAAARSCVGTIETNAANPCP
jgi:arylsulfatase A-like enzyme